MNASKLKQLLRPKGLAAATLVFAAASALLSPAANANTAANAVIRNEVSVSFADAANNPQTPVTARVDITVNLVAVAATTTQDTANATIAPSGTQVYTYSITTNANGPDIYTVSRAITLDETPVSLATLSSPSITLGATLSASAAPVNIPASGSAVVSVPADGTGLATAVNGLQAGDIVVVNGNVLSVSAINTNPSTPASGTVTLATITLANATASVVTVNYGDLIKERQTFTVTVDPGTYSGPGDKLITHTVDATDGVNASAQLTTTTTVAGLNVSVLKYVRNVTVPVVGGSPIVVTGLGTFYATGVNANPGNTLEYLIVIENALGASNANNVVIADGIPAFTNYVASSLRLIPTLPIATVPANGDFTAATDLNTDADGGETNTGTGLGVSAVTIFAGTGGDGNTNVGGVLGGDARTYGLFRVQVQ